MASLVLWIDGRFHNFQIPVDQELFHQCLACKVFDELANKKMEIPIISQNRKLYAERL